MEECLDNLVLQEEFSDFLQGDWMVLEFDSWVQRLSNQVEVGGLVRAAGSDLRDFQKGFRLPPDLSLEFSEGEDTKDSVSFSDDVEFPILLHENSRLLSKILVAEHIPNLQVVDSLSSFHLERCQFVLLADSQRSKHYNSEHIDGFVLPANRFSLLELTDFEQVHDFFDLCRGVPMEDLGFL
eukprot:CAMPEP_0170511680 /NCGR_PEP_ID=MMETSP0208-20121228/66436_1 /TAXON_ID=197538 /ORGANISM="Strombidium inclinatum, Strain S3" /LENGTH=181 /DNA_ID=CAMNT_0010795241 /DNA_START=1508 /DNA_END=2050 /DNA_ORIENTATION=+